MGKSKKHRPAHDEHRDKPSWAADWGVEPPKKPKDKDVKDVDPVTAADRFGTAVADKLAALKAGLKVMEAEQEKEQAAKANPARARTEHSSPVPKSAVANPEDPDATFAELFDPAEEDNLSFEDLLKSSKQDWRAYKE